MSESASINPADRAKKGIDGIPATLGDGQTWLLARLGLSKIMTQIRDEIYDHSLVRGKVDLSSLSAVLYLALAENYDLTDEEIKGLITSTKLGGLVDEITRAVVPLAEHRRTFTAWARSALFANGIRPSDVPPADLPHVLQQLVATGRAVPHEKYTEAGEASVLRGSLFAMAAQQQKEATPLHSTE